MITTPQEGHRLLRSWRAGVVTTWLPRRGGLSGSLGSEQTGSIDSAENKLLTITYGDHAEGLAAVDADGRVVLK